MNIVKWICIRTTKRIWWVMNRFNMMYYVLIYDWYHTNTFKLSTPTKYNVDCDFHIVLVFRFRITATIICVILSKNIMLIEYKNVLGTFRVNVSFFSNSSLSNSFVLCFYNWISDSWLWRFQFFNYIILYYCLCNLVASLVLVKNTWEVGNLIPSEWYSFF